MANTGYLDISGTDLINSYCTDLSATTFTGLNVFNNGTIAYTAQIIDITTNLTYTANTIPNLIFARGSNITIGFGTLPTTGVPDGFILQIRRNNETNATYTFSNVYNFSNTLTVSITPSPLYFGLIKYNAFWYYFYS
jgi:hypothetical protein